MKNHVQVFVFQPEMDELLARLNISRKDFAERIGIDQSWLTRIVSQEAPVSPKIRVKMLELLGCTFDDIFFIKYLRK